MDEKRISTSPNTADTDGMLVDDAGATIVPERKPVTADDIQRAHTRIASRLGDVACDGRDTIQAPSFDEF